MAENVQEMSGYEKAALDPDVPVISKDDYIKWLEAQRGPDPIPHDFFRKVQPEVLNDGGLALWTDSHGKGIWIDPSVEARCAVPGVAEQSA